MHTVQPHIITISFRRYLFWFISVRLLYIFKCLFFKKSALDAVQLAGIFFLASYVIFFNPLNEHKRFFHLYAFYIILIILYTYSFLWYLKSLFILHICVVWVRNFCYVFHLLFLSYSSILYLFLGFLYLFSHLSHHISILWHHVSSSIMYIVTLWKVSNLLLSMSIF